MSWNLHRIIYCDAAKVVLVDAQSDERDDHAKHTNDSRIRCTGTDRDCAVACNFNRQTSNRFS